MPHADPLWTFRLVAVLAKVIAKIAQTMAMSGAPSDRELSSHRPAASGQRRVWRMDVESRRAPGSGFVGCAADSSGS